jgi:HAMP domain-containing protein
MNRPMLELRKELIALVEWEAEDFPCPTQTEIDAVAQRVLRMAELLKRMREIAERN